MGDTLLTIDQKRQWVRDSKSFLDLFNRRPSDFLCRLVTIDETWIHYYTPESTQRAKQWVGPGGTAPKQAKTQQSAEKVMASGFWDFCQKCCFFFVILRTYWTP